MSSVCKWLSVYLCLRDTPIICRNNYTPAKTSDPDGDLYDAIIVWKEGSKDKNGGMAYDFILERAKGNTPKKTPSKERPLSQELIEKKLKDAEARRLSAELSKLEVIAKRNERAKGAVKKVEELNESFSKETKAKLEKKLQTKEEKRRQQLEALQCRVQQHLERVQQVREKYLTSFIDERLECQEKIEAKIERSQIKREQQISEVKERLQEHERHIQEVIEASQKINAHVSKVAEENLMRKMEEALKKREEQMTNFVDRMKSHEKRVQQVREKAKRLSAPMCAPVVGASGDSSA